MIMQPQERRAWTAENYLARVDFALRDLPWGMRRNLIAELRSHLDELPVATDLEAQLGTPADYAADLRSAAGLERRRGVVAFLRARRPRNLVLTAVALTVIGLAIGTVQWVESYQPLAFDDAVGYPQGAVDSPAGDSTSVVYQRGRPFQLGMDVKNAGAFTVRVLGLASTHFLPVSARVVMSPPMRANFAGFAPPFTRFHPFDLKPGQARSLVIEGVWADCNPYDAGSDMLVQGFSIRYSFLWKTATADIALPEELAIVVPKKARFVTKGPNCP
jgi:hypothetical protein